MRPATTRSPITATVERHSLAEVAQRTGIFLATTVGTVTVRCPLPTHGHPDRTPSMRLYLDDGRYFCFGCGTRGDVVQWAREAEGLNVADAIKLLDSGRPIANVWSGKATMSDRGTPDRGTLMREAELPELDRTPPERVRAALGAAYLASRAIDVTVLEAHNGRAEVGHTPAKTEGLVAALRPQGFSDDELVDAGLAYRRRGSSQASDFYRQRVLIPVRDDEGVCGFIGRNVGDGRWPKYKNPPRTHLYDKSVNLYRPLPAPRYSAGRVVVVEGTLDALAIACVALHSGRAGYVCPITQSGRELSGCQLDAALRLHRGPLVISFDGDVAGQDSNRRLLRSVLQRGREAVVITLPNDADPASWLAEHGSPGLVAWLHRGARRSANVRISVNPAASIGINAVGQIECPYSTSASSSPVIE